MSHNPGEAYDDTSFKQTGPDGMHVQPLEERGQMEAALRASEEHYRTIVQTANEGIWLIDTEAHTLYANERMVQMLGTTSGEIMTRTVLDFTFPEDEPEGRARISSNLQGHFEQFEFRFRRVDGSELYTMASTSPVRDGPGHIVGALGMFTDITTRKQMERALRQSEDPLRMALKNSPITVYQQDRDLRYTWIYSPLSAFTPETIIGKRDADFVAPEEAKRLTELKQRVLASGQSIREEIHITLNTGVLCC